MSAAARPSMRLAQREATRRNLLATARALFRARGVDAVAMEDIARAADVGRATVYLHFSGKQTLLTALLAEDWDSQTRLFGQLGRGGAIDRAAIAAWLGRVVEGMREARGSFGIHRVALGQDAEVAGLHRAHRRALATVLRELLGRDDAADTQTGVEAAMIVAEIEYLAAAAVIEWSAQETTVGIVLLTERIATFAVSMDTGPAKR